MQGATDKSIPVLRLPALRRPPTYDDLVTILRACEKNKDRFIIQPWSVPTATHLFGLQVFLAGSGDEYLRLKTEGKLVHPEWTLLIGPEQSEEAVWVYSTRDIDLILGLIMAEVEGQARAMSQPIATATLRNIPTRRRAAELEDSSASLPNSASRQDGQPGVQPGGMVLSGNIHGSELQNVIQSIGRCRLSGALCLTKDLEQAAIYFLEGEALEATLQKGLATQNASSELRGDHAFLEVMTWTQGSFSFDHAKRAYAASITRKTHTLLMEALLLRDYCDLLNKRRIDFETHFVKVNPSMSTQEVQQILQQGLPLGSNWQMSVYTDIRNGISLYELLKIKPMPKAIWAPVIFNLITLGLIDTNGQSQAPTDTQVSERFEVDHNLAAKFTHDMVRPDSGMVTQAAFSYLLQQEILRFQNTARTFRVILFEVRVRRGPLAEALDNDALKECALRFMPLMGPMDVLGHYQLRDFALIIRECGNLTTPQVIFDGFIKSLVWPYLPGIERREQLQVKALLYAPQPNGELIVQARKTYP